MSASRLELKVGMFVIVLLGIAAVMTLRFSETGLGLGNTKPALAGIHHHHHRCYTGSPSLTWLALADLPQLRTLFGEAYEALDRVL